jgi:hypothetical protein
VMALARRLVLGIMVCTLRSTTLESNMSGRFYQAHITPHRLAGWHTFLDAWGCDTILDVSRIRRIPSQPLRR